MPTNRYNESSIASIFLYARKLTGASLAEVVPDVGKKANQRSRGDLGNLVEKYYFEIDPPNNHHPDFMAAGVELKTTGVLVKKGKLIPKERLVLTMIDYQTIVDEEWETSALLGKCNLMLILFYEFDKDVPVVNRRFVIDPVLCRLSETVRSRSKAEQEFISRHVLMVPKDDVAVLRRDWEAIRQKVVEGKAHELSEGDTFYLGACRKGSGGVSEALRVQPNSTERAKSRAFSLKQGYIRKLLEGHSNEEGSLGVSSSLTFEEATRRRFEPFVGKSVDELSELLQHSKRDRNHKTFRRELAVRILARGSQSVKELGKADIEMKVIKVLPNGKPAESVSFPGFKYIEIVNQEWEESTFCERLERKFLFVVFRQDKDGVEHLDRPFYWNMPYEDRQEARRVWEETKRRVALDARDLPRSSESHIAHVRPKARNGQDREVSPQGMMLVKKCFWLNRDYVARIIAASS